MATLTHKTGDDLEWVATMQEDGVVTDITSWTIESEVRQTDGTLVQALTVTKTDAVNGVFSLTATDTQTATFPVGSLLVDVQITDASGIVFSTETFNLVMLEDITA